MGQTCLKYNNGYTSYSELLGSCQSLVRLCRKNATQKCANTVKIMSPKLACWGKNWRHYNLGVVLDFNQSTIQIDEILLPMRDIANLQLKSIITRALQNNLNHHAQEPVSTRSATKRVVEILDAKYEKAYIPAIVRENCSHLSVTDREKLAVRWHTG